MATNIIEPDIGRWKKTSKSPCDPINDCLIAGSAIGPRTIAKTAGARG